MKIGVIGTGNVGNNTANAMALKEVATEMVLVDRKEQFARAQAENLLRAPPFAEPVRISAPYHADLTGAGIVILDRGVGQKEGDREFGLLSTAVSNTALIVLTMRVPFQPISIGIGLPDMAGLPRPRNCIFDRGAMQTWKAGALSYLALSVC